MATVSNAVDPNQLLKALSTLLSREGGIKGPHEVTKLLILMKAARKMVSRCIYINILIATKEKDVKEKFMEEGGWDLLNTWLQDAKNAEQSPVILELIKIFKELPVTIDILKKNNTAKIIKSFSKTDEEEIKAMADDLVLTWKGVIRTSNADKDKEKEKVPPLKKKLKIKKIVKPGPSDDRDADDESEEPLAKKSRLSSITSEGEPMDTSDALTAGSKRLETRTRHTSGDKLEKTHKHGTRAAIAAAAAAASVKRSPVDAGKKDGEGKKGEEKEGEATTKRKAKILRPAHTKFRSTGLEKDADLPLPKMKKKISIQPLKHEKPIPTLTIRKDGPLFSKSLSPTEKRPRLDDSVKTSPSGAQSKIKIIPAKHKLQESSGFLDALNAPSMVVKKKPPKKVVRTNSTGGAAKVKSPTPPEEVKVEPPKFSFYSSNQPSEEEKKEEKTEEDTSATTTTTGTVDPSKEEGDMGEDWNEDRPITVGKSNLKFGPSKNKKKVRWKEETDLVDVYYFVLDETERVNVNRVKDFQDAMQIEKMMEKQAMLNAKMGKGGEEEKANGNITVEYFQWSKLIPIDLVESLTQYGINSTEKTLQAKREQTVLQEIFFDQMNLPLTPKEPDPETRRAEHIKVIPLEDEAGGDHHHQPGEAEPLFPPEQDPYHPYHPPYDQHLLPHPDAMMPPPRGPPMGPGGGGGGGGVPPVGAPGGPLLQTPTQHSGPRMPQGNTPPSPNTTIKNVQNLIASLEGDSGNQGSELLNKENLDKLKEMLEPFKHQMPGDNQSRDQGPPPPLFPQGPGNFGPGPGPGPGPRDFGPRGPHGPHHDTRGPFPPMGPDGHMDMGPGPHFDGPGMGGPGGPYGPRFGPGGPGPGYPGPRMGMGPPGRGMGYPERGMGPRGPWRGRGRGDRGGRGRGKTVCYHYSSERGCLRGDKCFFLHPADKKPPSS